MSSVAFSPDDKRIVAGETRASTDDKRFSFSEVKVWDAKAGQLLHTLNGHKGNVTSVAFSQDGTRFISAGGVFERFGELILWDTATGQELISLKGHTDLVTRVSWSTDGIRIMSCSVDRTVKVWEAP